MNFDAVFFDSGGTIFNTRAPAVAGCPAPQKMRDARGARTTAMVKALGHNAPESSVLDILTRLEAYHAQQHNPAYTFVRLIEDLYAELHLPALPEEVLCVTEAYCGPRYRSWLFPGIHAALTQLRDAGLFLGLIANTTWPGWVMDRVFRGVGLGDFFQVGLYSGDEGVAKPDASIFKRAEERAGMAGKRLLYIGDSVEYDVKGARNAGWASVLFRSSAASSEGLADFEIDAWDSLPAIILGD